MKLDAMPMFRCYKSMMTYLNFKHDADKAKIWFDNTLITPRE